MEKIKHTRNNKLYNINEVRTTKVLIGKSGGYKQHKISIPNIWIDALGINEENREVKISINVDTGQIIIDTKL